MTRRQLIQRAIALAAAHPGLVGLTATQRGEVDAALASVNPELRPAALAALAEMGATPRLSEATLGDIRNMYESGAPEPLPDVSWHQAEVTGSDAQPPVSVTIVNPAPDRVRPAILHVHGGGFVVGSARAFLPMLQSIARDLDCMIVSVDYRLAPEGRYADSLADNYTALKWLHDNADGLGADRSRLAVMGESAGGGHAALLALHTRDRGEVPLAFLCLIYPMLDDRTGSSRRAPPGIGELIWTAAYNRFGWEAFLGVPPGTSRVPPAAVPARADDLSGLPPCFIAVGSIDLFVAEDIAFAHRLIEAGVPTELLVLPGVFHGFDFYPEAEGTDIARQWRAARLDALRRGLGLAEAG